MKLCFSLVLSLSFLFLSGCTTTDDTQSAQFFAMDTFMTITAYGSSAQDGIDVARTEINGLDSLLSRTKEESDISLLNQSGSQSVTLNEEVIHLLTEAQTISQSTGGTFDVTVAPVLDAWGWTADVQAVPDTEALADALSLVGYDNLILDSTASTATFTLDGMSADLGGIAKGYATQQAQLAMEESGVTSALLNFGSTITAIGTKPDGTSFRVAIKDPQNTEDYFAVLDLADQTISTSGGYERYFEEDGVTYHHILDPRTGQSAQSDLLSVTVLSQDAPLTDALSTACYVLGSEGAIDLWRNSDLSPFELILVQEDGTVLITEGVESQFTLYGEEGGYHYEVVSR